jgi:hypothetical protein
MRDRKTTTVPEPKPPVTRPRPVTPSPNPKPPVRRPRVPSALRALLCLPTDVGSVGGYEWAVEGGQQ